MEFRRAARNTEVKLAFVVLEEGGTDRGARLIGDETMSWKTIGAEMFCVVQRGIME